MVMVMVVVEVGVVGVVRGRGARIVEVYNNQWFQHAHVIPHEISSPGLAVYCVICWQH